MYLAAVDCNYPLLGDLVHLKNIMLPEFHLKDLKSNDLKKDEQINLDPR